MPSPPVLIGAVGAPVGLSRLADAHVYVLAASLQ